MKSRGNQLNTVFQRERGAPARFLLSVFVALTLSVAPLPLPAFAQDAPEPLAAPADAAASETPDAPTDAVQEAVDAIAFVYIDEASVTAGQTEQVVVAFARDTLAIEQATLSYESLADGSVYTVPHEELILGSVLFSLAVSDALPLGGYRITGIDYYLAEDDEAYRVDFADDPESFTGFSVVSPEQLETLVAAAGTDGEPSGISVYSLDEDENLVEEENLEAALEDALDEGTGVSALATDSTPLAAATPIVTVALDPGHGGTYSGAVANGLVEKDLNLKVAQYCKAELEKTGFIKVYMTHNGNGSPDALATRAQNAAVAGASLLVSIHFNAGGGTGCEVWYPRNASYNNFAYTEGKALAELVLEKLAALGLNNRGAKVKAYSESAISMSDPEAYYPDRSEADYYGIIRNARLNGMTGIIIEHAFIDNMNDAAKLKDESFLKSLGVADAQAIALQVASYITLSANTVQLDGSITVAPVRAANLSGCTYNYVWRYGNDWSDWNSTVRSTGKNTSATSYTFTPTKPGTYTLYLDVVQPGGATLTTSKTLTVSSVWNHTGVNAPASATVGDTVTYSANVSGSKTGLTYNYVWRFGNDWSDWGSTVRSTGKNTTSTTGTFVPTKPGTYTLYVDVVGIDGRKVTQEKKVTVVKSWIHAGVNAPATATVGAAVTYSANVSGNKTGLTYNYVWRFGNDWADWNSTVRSTGKNTTSTTGSFTPTKPGTYTLYVDVVGADGRKETQSKTVSVSLGWAYTAVNAPTSAIVGAAVTYSANVSGNKAGLVYNYVWRYGNDWADWNSTVRSTGKDTTSATGSFVPSKVGTYTLYVDVTGPGNYKITHEQKVTVVGNKIMGGSQATVNQMVASFEATRKPYPALYASKGAPTIRDYCNLVLAEANAEGVRAEMLFAQAMLETGWLQFGGSVKVEQCNFGGLGATSSTVGGATFPDVRTGLRAQTQHLKAYASTAALANPCVDPRFNLVSRGVAPYVEQLNGRWAVSDNYGQNIVAQINKLLTYPR